MMTPKGMTIRGHGRKPYFTVTVTRWYMVKTVFKVLWNPEMNFKLWQRLMFPYLCIKAARKND